MKLEKFDTEERRRVRFELIVAFGILVIWLLVSFALWFEKLGPG